MNSAHHAAKAQQILGSHFLTPKPKSLDYQRQGLNNRSIAENRYLPYQDPFYIKQNHHIHWVEMKK